MPVARWSPCGLPECSLLSIGQITILVEDYDVGIDFFVRRLGFDLVEDTAVGDEKRWFVVAPPGGRSTSVLLARASDEAQRAHVGFQAGGRVAFFTHTDDFEADQSRLAAAGVNFLEAPRREPYGTVAVFEDCSSGEPLEPQRVLLLAARCIALTRRRLDQGPTRSRQRASMMALAESRSRAATNTRTAG